VPLARGDVLELGPMDWQDATDFLSKSLVRKELLRDKAITHKLLDELTRLPLVITQAAAYLNMNRTTITRYLRLLLPSVQSERQMEDAIGTLCGYSFLARRGNDSHATQGKSEDGRGSDESEEEAEAEEWYDIHRLVHLAMQIWIREHGDARKVVEDAVRQVADVFPSDNYKNQAVWRAYLPHALQLLTAEQDCDVKEKSKLCLWVVRRLDGEGRIRESVTWLEESCRLRSKLEEDGADELFSQHELAIAYQADGQVKKTVELLEAVVKAQETLIADHPD
jgi:hypothetical protein